MLSRGESIDHPLPWADPRSRLVIEPLRWALRIRPAAIVCEQVPPVLGYWELCASILRDVGYSAWAGILSAERFGVPQTRQRAFLIARRDGPANPPPATHQPFVKGEPPRESLGDVQRPWVCMAAALGWDPDDLVGFPRRNDRDVDGGDYRARDLRAGYEPAFNLTEKARSWTRWHYRNGNQPNAARRRGDEPAPTLHFGHALNSGVEWTTTPDEPWTPEGKGVAVQVDEASILQGFPPDYPWHGSRTAQFRQIGDAVPPPVARAVLASLGGLG